MRRAVDKLKTFKKMLKALKDRTDQNMNGDADGDAMGKVKGLFTGRMDDDLDVKGAFDSLLDFFVTMDTKDITPSIASGYLKALKDIDQVWQVLFQKN